MAGKPAASIQVGTTEVTTAQTPAKLLADPVGAGAMRRSSIGVWVASDPNNVGASVAVGDSNVNAKATIKEAKGFQLLKAGAPFFIETEDPYQLYGDAVTSKDNVLWVVLWR